LRTRIRGGRDHRSHEQAQRLGGRAVRHVVSNASTEHEMRHAARHEILLAAPIILKEAQSVENVDHDLETVVRLEQ
jgi:hypothetical protein